MSSVLIYTLGCKLNQLESEAYAYANANAGNNATSEKQPSIVIVNTCTVTSKADQKARRVIRKALRDYPQAVVVVTGCYAKLEKEGIENLSPADADAHRLIVLKREDVLNFINPSSQLSVSASYKTNTGKFQFFPGKFTSHTRPFLKIQDGCDNHCTYCRIRLARGKSISLSAEQTLERLKILEAAHCEAVLTGVNICQYKDSKNPSAPMRLCEMTNYLLLNTDKINIRLSSLEPEYINECFANVLSHKRIRPHFHLSIQSCSEKVLQKMGRSYNGETIKKAVSLLRSVKDDPFLACDIIAGFCGESEAQFNETYELCKKIGFAWIHVFPYSKRPGTPAFSFTDNVQESEITRRVLLLTELAWQGRADYVKRWLGRETEAVVEKKEKKDRLAMNNGQCRALSNNYLKLLVRCKGAPPAAGTVIRCRLTAESGNFDNFDAAAEIV